MTARAPALRPDWHAARQPHNRLQAKLAPGQRRDLSEMPPGAMALWAAGAPPRPRLWLVADEQSAQRLSADLRFFVQSEHVAAGAEGQTPAAAPPGAGAVSTGSGSVPDRAAAVLHFPELDTNPYLDVASDRRAAMARLATLGHLVSAQPWQSVVASVGALLRRVPPADGVRQHVQRIVAEEEIDLDALLATLERSAYLRVPLVEDPGTFALRGGILDLFPAHASRPVRIEFDDWLVLSIRPFDPEEQRSLAEVSETVVYPARDVVFGAAEIATARRRIRALGDALSHPSSKVHALIESLAEGRLGPALSGMAPAFHPALASLLDYLPTDVEIVLVDPAAVAAAATTLRAKAEDDYAARVDSGQLCFAPDEHYLDAEALTGHLAAAPVQVVHHLAVAGQPESAAPDAAVWQPWTSIPRPEALEAVGSHDQMPLRAQLKTARSQGGDHALRPLVQQVRAWMDEGLRVLFVARTHTQSERLRELLRRYGLLLQVRAAGPLEVQLSQAQSQGQALVAVGSLADGFVWPAEALAVVTEEEIFGDRSHRRRRAAKRQTQARAFLEDLRELRVGDFVVHVDHGVGRYLGLERKALGQSQAERLRGDAPLTLEVMAIEYRDGRLFLPVTRLNQLEKHASRDGHTPKLDKLGGQSFAKTKARVRKEVKQMADALLKLYAQRAAHTRAELPSAGSSYAEFEATFPFEETHDQARAIEEVLQDLERPQPMDRLVCGDVGFGKTEVAMRAAFRVAMAGRQVAVLCPTTVLAQQHYLTFRERFADYPLKVEVLSRFVERKAQSQTLARVKEGKVDVIVGTHRLLSKDVHFRALGLLVVDEEQRFGVTHKERIKQLRTHVDVLTLSATPIPRTLQLAVTGLRDLSLITTPPTDRRAVRTFVCRWDAQLLKEAIERELNRGGQIFFVHNRIEGLYEHAQRLQELVPGLRLAVAHGQMKEGALESVMTDFVEGRYDMLCATAIIESGLDIPRANTILINRADLFGLAQLYQLRGRVGRARERAYCYLITPAAEQMSEEARFRVQTLERFTQLGSGFHVASLDMELRGAGDMLGAEQSGAAQAVGIELFVQMLQEAIAELKGEPAPTDIDPEVSLDLETYLPDDYIEDVGLRLSFYKRLAAVESEAEASESAEAMEDRFGPLPEPAQNLVRAMALKPALRQLRAAGCEARGRRVVLHLQQDTPLDPEKVMALVAEPGSTWRLSPDLKLSVQVPEDAAEDAAQRVRWAIEALAGALQGRGREAT
ncbi:MAG: transcription-repair coupling factor [Polyangiales bacterium]